MLTYEEICNLEYLKEEARLALESSNSKPSSEKEKYIKHSEELIKVVQESLINETYCFSALRTKTIYEPKERKIDIPPFFPDRIYQHAMMDAVKDKFLENFIDNTFSSIKGKGLLTCKNTIESIISTSQDWYYVNIDVKKYFESIDHEILKSKILELGIDPRIYRMHSLSIDIHSPGIAIGCFPSQYYANLYLSDFDHMMLWVTQGKYVRYMDNCVFWVRTKQEAKYWLKFIMSYFDKFLKLRVKNNWQIAPVNRQPLSFCGYVFFHDHTLLRKNIKVAAKNKAAKLDKMGVSDKEWKLQMSAYFGWFYSCSGANLWNKLKNGRGVTMPKAVKKGIKSLKDIKNEGEFELTKEDRVSIVDLVGKEIVVLDAYVSKNYRNGDRLVVKFQAVLEKQDDGGLVCGDEQYFVTGSKVLEDKILLLKDKFPFTCHIVRTKSTKGTTSFFTIE